MVTLLMRPKSRTLTDHELEIMNIVWELESATVKAVHQRLLQKRKIAYTSVLTMMKILHSKQYLRRKLSGRAYTYFPTRSKEAVVQSMLREFVERVFNGSTDALLICLLRVSKLDRQGLLRLSRLAWEQQPAGNDAFSEDAR